MSLRAISPRASSQDISFHFGSTPIPFTGIGPLEGHVQAVRVVEHLQARTALSRRGPPLDPMELSGFPSSFTATPSTRWTRRPHSARHLWHCVGIHASSRLSDHFFFGLPSTFISFLPPVMTRHTRAATRGLYAPAFSSTYVSDRPPAISDAATSMRSGREG